MTTSTLDAMEVIHPAVRGVLDPLLRAHGLAESEFMEMIRPYEHGRVYVTGSHAVGLATRTSDVDFLVVTASVHDTTQAALFGSLAADVRYVTPTRCDAALAQLGSDSIGTRSDAWILSRCLTAVPLRQATPLVFADDRRVLAELALEKCVRRHAVASVALAELAEAANAQRSWHLMHRAALAIWELALVRRRDFYIGTQWLPARSRRIGYEPVRSPLDVADTASLAELAASEGLESRMLADRVRLMPNVRAERWALPHGTFYLLGARHLVPVALDLPSTVGRAIACGRAGEILALVAAGALCCVPDVDVSSGVVEDGRSGASA